MATSLTKRFGFGWKIILGLLFVFLEKVLSRAVARSGTLDSYGLSDCLPDCPAYFNKDSYRTAPGLLS